MKIDKKMVEVMIPRVERLFCPYYTAFASGLRMSGEMWTSLGNGFSNFIMFYFEASERGITIKGLVEGDDGVFSSVEKFIDNEVIESFGFRIKIEYRTKINDTCFCGNLFDEEEEQLIISPEQISRFMWTCQRKYMNCNERVAHELLKSKAMSLYVLGKHTPIASWLSFKCQQILKESKTRSDGTNYWWERKTEELAKTETFVPPTITMKARMLYADKFRIGISEQLEIESMLKKATTIEGLFINRSFMDTGKTTYAEANYKNQFFENEFIRERSRPRVVSAKKLHPSK